MCLGSEASELELVTWMYCLASKRASRARVVLPCGVAHKRWSWASSESRLRQDSFCKSKEGAAAAKWVTVQAERHLLYDRRALRLLEIGPDARNQAEIATQWQAGYKQGARTEHH